MDNLLIKEEENNFFCSPKIDFNAANGECSISGESFIENTVEFYCPVFEWIKNFFSETPDATMKLSLDFSYYNTSSSKALYDLLFLLKKGTENGATVKIIWKIPEDDFEMEDDVIDIISETGLNIDIVY